MTSLQLDVLARSIEVLDDSARMVSSIEKHRSRIGPSSFLTGSQDLWRFVDVRLESSRFGGHEERERHALHAEVRGLLRS
jgi:hypothetical protein